MKKRTLRCHFYHRSKCSVETTTLSTNINNNTSNPGTTVILRKSSLIPPLTPQQTNYIFTPPQLVLTVLLSAGLLNARRNYIREEALNRPTTPGSGSNAVRGAKWIEDGLYSRRSAFVCARLQPAIYYAEFRRRKTGAAQSRTSAR